MSHFAAPPKLSPTQVTKYWWVRGVLYLGITCGAWALYIIRGYGSQNIYLCIPVAGLDAAAVLFIVASVRNELQKPAGAAAPAVAGGSDSRPAGGMFASMFQKKADAAVTSAATAAGAAAGKSAAQSMFGGGGGAGKDPENPAPVPAPAPAPASSATASMFTGGGLFGGGSERNKYGYDSNSPEANPFVG